MTITQGNHTTDKPDKDGENDDNVVSKLINELELIRLKDLIKTNRLNY